MFVPFEMDQTLDPDGAVRLSLSGELDLAVVERLEVRLGQLRAAQTRVRLDLSKLEFIDSTGLRLLLQARQGPGADGWSVEIDRHVAPAVQRLFRLTHVEPFIWG